MEGDMIKKPKYTKDEKAFIEKWGAKAELGFDQGRYLISPITGKRITTLGSAQARKKAIEEIENLKKDKSA